MPAWLSGLRDLIVEASPVRRAMLALLVLVPLAALAAAYVWFYPTDYRLLYAKLSDRAGGEVIAALERLDIPYRLAASDGSIEVPSDRLHATRYRLAAQGLPRSDEDVQADVGRPGFGASSLQEQQRYQRALEIDLARSIQLLETVELARVHLALPRVSPFLRDAPPATAAVVLRLRPGAQLSAGQVTTIQTLVAAGVPRLRSEDVQVLDPRGVLLGGAAPAATQSRRLAVEQDLARRVLAVLEPWLGADRVSVQVTAMLEDSETRQTVERMRSLAGSGPARPLERTVRTTRVPEGRIQRINAIVILGFDVGAAELRRAEEMARQALGLSRSRGDRLSVFALPAAVKPRPQPAPAPLPQAPESIPQVRASEPPSGATAAGTIQPAWLALGAALLGALAVTGWRRSRRPPTKAPADDFEQELATARSRALADPRVVADVVKLWMRA